MVGPSQLTPDLAEGYNFQENGTHFSVIVPYTAMDTAFEVHQTAKSPHKSSALDNFPLSYSWLPLTQSEPESTCFCSNPTTTGCWLISTLPATFPWRLLVRHKNVCLLLGLYDISWSFLPLLPSECYPNGTMTALAVKVESVPNLIPSWLTLKDQSCKPVSSDDRFAYFSFSVDSCGTTRTVSSSNSNF